jgi:hypothetical protein
MNPSATCSNTLSQGEKHNAGVGEEATVDIYWPQSGAILCRALALFAAIHF